MFKNLRIKIFNWFASGRLTLNNFDKPKEYQPMSSYVIGGGGSSGTLNISPNGNMGYNTSSIQNGQTLTLKITPANGGTIVQIQPIEFGSADLHIIPDGADFDRELGKIITMSKLKA
jgi:hypothetical protein